MEYKNFVILVPSYNNAKWYEQNLLSLVGQNYPEENYKIIYINDCSTDGTGDLVENLIHKNGWKNIELINNTERKGALQNIYNAIHNCDPNVVVADADGDDMWSNNNVLNCLNQEYQNPDVWMTWGSYIDSGPKTRGCARPYEKEIIANHSYRYSQWRCSHLRSRYAKLFQLVKKEDLMYQNKFFNSAWDEGFAFPMLEMCAGRFSYINDILYIYNNDNPISDYKVHAQEQAFLDRYIRGKKPYAKLDNLW